MSLKQKKKNPKSKFPNFIDLPPHDRGRRHMRYKNEESDYTITDTEKIIDHLKQDVNASLAQESDTLLKT